MPSQRFREDTAGTLEFYPPEAELGVNCAALASATVALYTPGGGVLHAVQSATKDALSTTVKTGANEGGLYVDVNDTTPSFTPVRSRRYVVHDAPDFLVVTCRDFSAITSGWRIYITTALPAGMASGSTFCGLRLSVALTTADTDVKDHNYRAHWTYATATDTYHHEDTFDVVAAKDWYPTTITDLLEYFPTFGDFLEDSDSVAETILAKVWCYKTRMRFSGREVSPDTIRNFDDIVPIHVHDVIAHLLWLRSLRNPELAPAATEAEARANLVAESVMACLAWVDADEDLAAGDNEESVNRSDIMVHR